MLTNSIQTGNDQETMLGKAQAQSRKPIDTDGYVSPVVVALGNLESVRSLAYGRQYDGPNTPWLWSP